MSRKRKRAGVAKYTFKVPFNVGATLDIITGDIIRGTKGEYIIQGGITDFNFIGGMGNSFKSTISHYLWLSMMDKIESTHEGYCIIYDTENNIFLNRLKHLSKNFEYLTKNNFIDEAVTLSDSTSTIGDIWWDGIKKYAKEITKKEKKVKYTIYPDYEDYLPTTILIDSLSKFTTQEVQAMIEKAGTDEKKKYMAYAKENLFKKRMISELINIAPESSLYFMNTAHIKQVIDMSGNPYAYKGKKVTNLRSDLSFVGVSNEIYYLSKLNLLITKAEPLLSSDKTESLYPVKHILHPNDLQLVTGTIIRNKFGFSGGDIQLVLSQYYGLLPHLTEFHLIKTHTKSRRESGEKSVGFGLVGNNIHYSLVLYPEVKLSRHKIRPLLESNKKLRRAVQITADLLQVKYKFPEILRQGLWLPPEELYDKIKAKGYNWDELLNSRNWYAIDQYSDKIPPFLSIIDLLYMANTDYRPYWLR